MNNSEVLENFNNLFNENQNSITNGIVYLIKNKKEKYEKNLKTTITLKKNIQYWIELTRNYDLLSDFIFEYDQGDQVNFIEIKKLPLELNKIIKSYLKPKYNIDIYISTKSENLKKADYINSNKKYIIKKKIDLNMENLGQSFLSYVSNHLPMVSIQYVKVYLKFISNQNTDLTIKLKGTLLDDELRRKVATEKYMYKGENKLVILRGMIAVRQ